MQLEMHIYDDTNLHKKYTYEWLCEKQSLRVLTHQKPPRRFCMLFFDVLPFTTLPFTTLAVSVNGKASKKSVPKRRGGVWCV